MIGIVKFWSEDHRWGFLQVDDEPDIFVHLHGLAPSMGGYLTAGDRVQFRIGTHPKTGRACAVDVRTALKVGDVLRAMKSYRGYLDAELSGLPGANEPLTDLRHLLVELEQIASA